jgi:hypothetical protein
VQQDGIAAMHFKQPVRYVTLRLSANVVHSGDSDSTGERKCHAVIAVLNCGCACSEASLGSRLAFSKAYMVSAAF